MSTTPTLTPQQIKAHEYYEKNKALIKARSKAWRENNHERHLAQRRINYFEQHELKKAKGREYARRRRVSGTQKKAQIDWRAKNPERVKALTRGHHHRMIRKLTDTYIRTLLRKKGINHPSPDQISHRRGIIAAKRSTRFVQAQNIAEAICHK